MTAVCEFIKPILDLLAEFINGVLHVIVGWTALEIAVLIRAKSSISVLGPIQQLVDQILHLITDRTAPEIAVLIRAKSSISVLGPIQQLVDQILHLITDRSIRVFFDTIIL